MQEIKHTGEDEFTENVGMPEIKVALNNPANRAVVIHRTKSSFDEAKAKAKRKQKRRAQKLARRKSR